MNEIRFIDEESEQYLKALALLTLSETLIVNLTHFQFHVGALSITLELLLSFESFIVMTNNLYKI